MLRWAIFLLCAGFTLSDDSCPGLKICFCSKDKTSVNCEGKHLTSLPDNIPDTATKLYLSFNNFASINTGEFSHLYRLEKLILTNNKISVINPNAFANLSMLSYVDLTNNKLQALGDKAFANLTRLSKLFLTNNQISSVAESAFSNATSLTFINVQANDLTEVPALGELTSLKELILVSNAITKVTFPRSYQKCKRLSYINLTQNKIKALTNDSFAVLANNSISTLALSDNEIAHVDADTFKPLSTISSLKLGNNPLDSVNLKAALKGLRGKAITSLDISHLKVTELMNDTFSILKNMTIKTLNMKYNHIPTLRDFAFTGLNDLIQLDISNCDIETTSQKAFYGMDKLTLLNMQKNKLVDVPKNLPSSLNILFLDDNQITTIHNKAFSNLVMLRELRIRYNKIINLEGECFYGLSNLAKLSLRNNYISSLPGNAFDSVVHLTSLDLSSNNLVGIQQSPGRFSSLGSLVYLSLADNNCEYFQPDLFKNLISLKYLRLDGNRLGNLVAQDYGGTLFLGLKNLLELYLMDNDLKAIPDPSFQDLASLTFLNSSKNKITGWGGDLFKTPTKLLVFDASFNMIATIKEDNVKDFTSMQYWNLTGNPLTCDCDLRWFRDWINKTKITMANLEHYTCNAPPNWAKKPLLSFDRTKINCEHYTMKIIIIACAVVAIVVIIIGALIYVRRWHIKLFWYKMTRRNRRKRRLGAADGRGGYGAIVQEEEGWRFDAYISCAEEDKLWAREHLLPGIDKGQIDEDHKFGGEYSLYFEDRDAIPGESLVGNIFENMVTSRKVIAVLSQNYLTDKMHMFELDLAIDEMYEKTIEEIIVIHIDRGLPERKIPRYLLKTMKRHHVIEWSEDMNAQELFRHTLIERLAVRANAADLDAD